VSSGSKQGSRFEKLVIAPVVQAILGTSALSELVDTREHTEVVCLRCHRTIAPEDPEPATLVLGVSEDTMVLINFAHATCLDSGVYDIDARLRPVAFGEVSFTAYPVLRPPPASPRPMIIFEFGARVMNGPGGDRYKDLLLDKGWEPVTDSWERISARPVPGLCVAPRGDQIVVADEVGELIAFQDAVVPRSWWQEAAAEGVCLVVYGAGLGLDRISFERINSALQASRCAAGLALVERKAALEATARGDMSESASSSQPGLRKLAEGESHHGKDHCVAIFDDGRRCSPWYELTGSGRADLETAIDRAEKSGAPVEALVAHLEALAAGDMEEAERIIRDSLGQ
jgi:hypothetical protein